MNRRDFYFDLPEELIAQYPLPNRSGSRMLVHQKSSRTLYHQAFCDLPDWLQEGDLLVMNDSKVIPARLYGSKPTGGKVEFLIERLLDKNCFLAHIKGGKSVRPDMLIQLDKNWQVRVAGKEGDLYLCEASGDPAAMMQEVGHIPLPPYICRDDESLDDERYQTIYARHKGSVAAPTAGLHFDESMFNCLKQNNIQIDYVTLHVGAGTFRPVRSEKLAEHSMHSEFAQVSEKLCERIYETKRRGNRVIPVGTTAMRSLESAAQSGELKPFEGETSIFIYPGYTFKVCDALLTNFHLPESTLLMLVSAFIGHTEAMSLYQEAIAEKYRFFSYGDVSLLI